MKSRFVNLPLTNVDLYLRMVKSYPPPFLDQSTGLFYGFSISSHYTTSCLVQPSDSKYWRHLYIYIHHTSHYEVLYGFFLIVVYIYNDIIWYNYVCCFFSGSITISHWPENSWHESRPWWFPNPIPIYSHHSSHGIHDMRLLYVIIIHPAIVSH